MNMNKKICLNCGKCGHHQRQCSEPINSYGIICFTICPSLGINNKHIEHFFYNKYLDISEFNYSNLNNIKLIPYFYDKIKILMIRRKNSMNYIEFIRGKYDINQKEHIFKLLQLMTQDENIKIKNINFDELWNELWNKTATSKIYQKEYNASKNKFNQLKENNFYGFFDDQLSKYKEAEWGFPKGRRAYSEFSVNNKSYWPEKNIHCALREFCEETSIDLSNLHILERLTCLEEEYIGTNLINYKHIYYLASTETELELNLDNNYQLTEIGDIGWFTILEAIEKTRPYYEIRIKLIYQLYFFIINLVSDILKNTPNKLFLNLESVT